MMTNGSGGASGGASGGFRPHYVWGQYDDGHTDIVGDFVTSADVSIGGNVQIDSSLKVSGNLSVTNNASVGKLYVDSSLSGTTITDIYDKLQALSDLIQDVSSRVPNSSS